MVKNRMLKNGNIIEWWENDLKEYGEYHRYYVEFNGTKFDIDDWHYLDLVRPNFKILRLEDEYFTAYYNFDKKWVYIQEDIGWDEDYENELYQGLSKEVIKELTEYLHFDNYHIDTYFYDYESACTVIKKAEPEPAKDGETTLQKIYDSVFNLRKSVNDRTSSPVDIAFTLSEILNLIEFYDQTHEQKLEEPELKEEFIKSILEREIQESTEKTIEEHFRSLENENEK